MIIDASASRVHSLLFQGRVGQGLILLPFHPELLQYVSSCARERNSANSFFLPKIVLVILGPVLYYLNVRISLSTSTKHLARIFF